LKVTLAAKRYLYSDAGIGILVSAIAFLCTLGLMVLVSKHYYTAMVGAVAIACLLRGWRAGLASLATGILGVALLMPPTFRMEIDTPAEVLILLVFGFSSGVICLTAYINDRRQRELRIAESQRRNSEQWLQTAQQFTRFWTWEIDLDRKLVKWVNPYGELKARVYEPLESWMNRIHPDDRGSWIVALEEARFSNSFELEFRVPGPTHDRFYVAKGMMTDDPVSEERRLVGISVQIRSPRSSVTVQDESQFSLYGVQDLLDNLAENPHLDSRARRNLDLAREILNRVLPHDPATQRRVV
jgi:K+-sensing histidine kinase KdpD